MSTQIQNTHTLADIEQALRTLNVLQHNMKIVKTVNQTPASEEKISNMAEIRSRIRRLDTLYSGYNMDLKWRDTVLRLIKKDAQYVREEYERHWLDNKICKYSYSFYDAIAFKYLKEGIQAIKDLEQQYGIHQTIYRANKMSYTEKDLFNVFQITKYSDEDFQRWVDDRILDFANMFNVPVKEKEEMWKHEACYRKDGKAIFEMALYRAWEPYNQRIYKDYFWECVEEFGCGIVGEDIAEVYNCKETTPKRAVSKHKIREYIVNVVEDCLVI